MNFTTKSGNTYTLLDTRTRKIQREYNEALFDGVIIRGGVETTEIPLLNTLRANDLLVMAMLGIDSEKLDCIPSDDYDEIVGFLMPSGTAKGESSESSAKK